MENHPIENLMKTTMENIKDMIDVNTIVGDPVESKNGTVIIPISKLTFGFGSGGSEFSSYENSDNSNYPFGGGSGAGITIKPVAFLVVKSDSVKLLPLDQSNSYDKIIDSFPQVIDSIKDLFKKYSKNDDCCDDDCSNNTSDSSSNEGDIKIDPIN